MGREQCRPRWGVIRQWDFKMAPWEKAGASWVTMDTCGEMLITQSACLCFVLFWTGSVFAADWPQWRGPNRDAVWTESGIVEKLPKSGLEVHWRTPVAMGYSSPVILAGKVYLSDAELKKPLVRERVHCLAADSGKALWTYSYEHSVPDWFFTEGQARGPGATPIARQGKVYALDLFGSLVCLDTRRGNLAWKKNLKEEFQMKETSVDSSPLIEGDLLILMLGGKGGAGEQADDCRVGGRVLRIGAENRYLRLRIEFLDIGAHRPRRDTELRVARERRQQHPG